MKELMKADLDGMERRARKSKAFYEKRIAKTKKKKELDEKGPTKYRKDKEKEVVVKKVQDVQRAKNFMTKRKNNKNRKKD